MAILSVLFLIVFIYSLYKRDDVTRAISKSLSLEGRHDILPELMEEYLGCSKYSLFKLGVALITIGSQKDSQKILLFKLRSGEYEGSWGLPAGYIIPGGDEYYTPLLKSEYEIEKYLGIKLKEVGKEDLEYKGPPLTLSKPLWLEYSNIPQVETSIHEYLLKNPNIIGGNGHIIFDYSKDKLDQEIKKLGGLLNPLVHEILKEYKGVVFSKAFEKKIKAFKDKRLKKIEKLRSI